jgi:hypothetical protein
MTALRERIEDMNRFDDVRKLSRLHEIDRQEDAAKRLHRELVNMHARVKSMVDGFDMPVAERDWDDVLELLDDAAKTADSIVGACRAASDDEAMEG